VHLRYSKNDTSKVLWAVFEIDKLASEKPKILEYKIRSSEIGENQMIMTHEEEPAYKGKYPKCILINKRYRTVFYYCTLWTGKHGAISWSEVNLCLHMFTVRHFKF